MSASETLKATKRQQIGTRHAKRLRAEGRIPANLQGDGRPHVDFSIDAREFMATRRHHTHLYDLDIDGKTESAVVRELQWDVFGESIVHIEFKRVTRGKKTQARVALEFVGRPKSGVVNHLHDYVDILCLPSAIPDAIEVKVAHLEEGQMLHVRDLELPAGFEMVSDAALPVCSIVGARAEVAPTPGEDDAGAAPAAPGKGTPPKE